MAIGTVKGAFSSPETRRNHRSGGSAAKFIRDSGARLDMEVVPDASGLFGCMLGLAPFASTLMVSGTMYAVYLGRATGGKRFSGVSLISTVVGAGAASGVMGYATTAVGPDYSDKADLTVQAVGTTDTVAVLGRRSTTPLVDGVNRFVPTAGVHVWAFALVANATTQPTVWGLTGDVGAGAIQVATGQSVAACVVGKVYTTAARPAASITAFQSPRLFCT